jgi:hypothetical protein
LMMTMNLLFLSISVTAPFHEDVQIITLLVHNQKINYLHM